MSFLEKMCGKLGLMEAAEAEEETKQPVAVKQPSTEEQPIVRTKKTPPLNNVVSLHASQNVAGGGKQQVKVMVVEPFSFDDAQHIADHIRGKKPVVINFENTDPEVAKRMIDFISGTTYALTGNIQKIGNNIFLCAPSNVDVSYTPQSNDHGADNNDIVMPWVNK